MKFGDSLWQRSVPQWASYNVDYADIKFLIREHTTPGKGKAVSIPGHDEDNADAFEDRLYAVFAAQHQRLNQFVKSKIYEINSRLVWIGRQIYKLTNPSPQSLRTRKPGNDLMRKCSTLETELLKTGQEIQDLSRFISVQRLALRKLLKKYKKWGRSATLEQRVETQLLKQPDSFSQQTFDAILSKYSAYYHVLRDLLNKRPGVEPANATYKTGLEFDASLDQSISSFKSETAVYWVHPDNVVELRVALLQYFNQLTFEHQSPKFSAPSQEHTASLYKEDRVGSVICDILKRYAIAQSDPPSIKARDKHAEPYVRARWTRNGQAAVSLPAAPSTTSSPDLTTCKIPRKKLAEFLDTGSTFNPHSSDSEISGQESKDAANNQQSHNSIRQWMAQRSGIRPLVSVRCKRTRYVGLESRANKTLKAVLDTNIIMSATALDELQNDKYFDTVPKGVMFPHAVLSICSEVGLPELIRLLDESHLTERVSDFSIEVHAVATCCNSTSMRSPYWIPALSKDIRHIPEAKSPLQRYGSSLSSSGTRTPGRASISDRSRSTDQPSSSTGPTSQSATSSPENTQPGASKRARASARNPPAAPPVERLAPQVYWNEYDNPEPGEGTDEYVIYLDPNAEDFPGQKALMNLFHRLGAFFKRSKLKWRPKTPAFSSYASSSDDDDAFSSAAASSTSSSDEETPLTFPRPPKSYSHQHHYKGPTAPNRDSSYGTILTLRQADPAAASAAALAAAGTSPTGTLIFASLALFAAVVVLALAALLALTGRRKRVAEVDAGVVVGGLASLLLAVAAVAAVLRLRARVRAAGVALRAVVAWEALGLVTVVFVGVSLGVGVLLGAVLKARGQ